MDRIPTVAGAAAGVAIWVDKLERARLIMKEELILTLHKDGDSMGISSRAQTVGEFWDHFCDLFAHLIEGGKYQGDWEFQLQYWLPATHEIVEKIIARPGDSWVTTHYNMEMDICASLSRERNLFPDLEYHIAEEVIDNYNHCISDLKIKIEQLSDKLQGLSSEKTKLTKIVKKMAKQIYSDAMRQGAEVKAEVDSLRGFPVGSGVA